LLYVLYTLFVLSCIVIVVSILLQPGKADAGALFTSSVSSTAFGPRGTQTLLAKITIVATVVFMLSALFISVPYFTGARSVLQSVYEQPAPATPAATPLTNTVPASTTTNDTSGATSANANAAPSSNSNASSANANQKSSQTNANKQASQNKK
jgi:preprotein translocase subunit SecG